MTHSDSANFQRIERALNFLETNFRDQPSLDEIAASVGLSKFHFQRLFKTFAGITPTQFLHYLTVEYAKSRLAESRSVFDCALDAGLSGGSRLHDMFVNIEAVSPGEHKEQGSGVKVQYGVHGTRFGDAFLAITKRGVCSLRFLRETSGTGQLLQELSRQWPKADFEEDRATTGKVLESVFARDANPASLTLLVNATNFQVKVWQALLAIPEGALMSYEDVAALIGKPTATRAVASAIAKNPIAYLIPCHRVISKIGAAHQYRWGSTRKKIMIGYEAAIYED